MRRKKLKIVYFDLETTGGRFHEIIQIGAKYMDERNCWQQYILPDGEISYKATEIHGMYKDDGIMYNSWHRPLAACSPSVGFNRFINFLYRVKGQSDNVTVVLCAHNCRSFDSHGKSFHYLFLETYKLRNNLSFCSFEKELH